MDGVLWHDETPVPGLVKFFATLQANKLGFVLATNNATKTSVQYVQKLARFGVKVHANQILTSSEATALFLREQYPEGKHVYVIGENGLHTALQDQGFILVNEEEPPGDNVHVDFVVVGMTRHVCYVDFAKASKFINHGARFVGTNPDVTFPTENGPLPGAGSLLAFIEAATGEKPIVIGKPNIGIFKEALWRLNAAPGETFMVGDRLNTDIAGAQEAGIGTILLLSGVTTEAHLVDSDIQPNYIFANLQELTIYLASEGERIFQE
jgi:4-nitrophenyl phosphatase